MGIRYATAASGPPIASTMFFFQSLVNNHYEPVSPYMLMVLHSLIASKFRTSLYEISNCSRTKTSEKALIEGNGQRRVNAERRGGNDEIIRTPGPSAATILRPPERRECLASSGSIWIRVFTTSIAIECGRAVINHVGRLIRETHASLLHG
jgi:hypothetical protein